MGLTLVITGAGGFIGRATVAAALRHGHTVRALVRRDDILFPPEVELHVVDLARDAPQIAHALHGADAVIHAAAAMSGDAAITARDTLAATKTLFDALEATAPSARLVLLSSIAVYDADATDITETTPLDPDPATRDGYARSKLAQEALLQDRPFTGWLARPGAVFGPGRLWNAHLGQQVGPVFLRLGRGEIPLVGLDACAEALILAATTPVPHGGMRPVNLVESDLPDASRYLAALGPAAPRLQIPLSWRSLVAFGRLFGIIPRQASRLPGLLQPRTLRFRFGPKHFSNARAENELGWQPHLPLENALHAAVEAMP